MAISFPLNPTIGDTHTASGKTWTWNGAQWEGVPAVVNVGIPSGETADRPSTPSIGDQFYNGTLGVLEIYTSSGWLPATGANDFNVVLTGEDTSVILDKEYFTGAYTITSALNDTSFDLYLFDTQGASAGYTKTPSINATNNFNKVVVLGGTAGDLLSFSYKTTFTTSAETSALGAGPIIKSISVADLPIIDDTTVITGINFAENVEVTFTGTNAVALPAKSVVRSSATSLIVTRPDGLIQDYSPYTVTVTNPGIIPPTGTNGHISTNAITAGGDPTWVTSSGTLPGAIDSQAYSVTLVATDPDGGAISYDVVSGQLPSGLSLNSNTGEISGSATTSGTSSFTISATDSGGNTTNRSFTISAYSISSILASGLVTHVSAENLTAGQTYSSVTPLGGSMGGTYTSRNGGGINTVPAGDISVVNWGSGKAFDQRGAFGLVSTASLNISGQQPSTIVQVGEVNNAAGNANGSSYHIGLNFGEPNGTNNTRAIASNGTSARSVWYGNDVVYGSLPSSVGVKDYQILRNESGTANFVWENRFASFSGSIATINGDAYSTGAPSRVWSHWRDDPVQYPYGYIAEFMIFDRYLSDTEVATLKEYLAIKYGIN